MNFIYFHSCAAILFPCGGDVSPLFVMNLYNNRSEKQLVPQLHLKLTAYLLLSFSFSKLSYITGDSHPLTFFPSRVVSKNMF